MFAKKISFLLLLSLALALIANGQGAIDALRYSTFEVGGTARTIGAGGALGALGTDFAVLGINPAGLAMYRQSEFVITPNLFSLNTESILTNDKDSRKIEENRSLLTLDNFGVVFASVPSVAGGWKTLNFGLGFNQIQNFNRTFFFQGRSAGSIVDRFQEFANAEGLDDFESGVAFEALALYDFNEDGFYDTDFELAPEAAILREQLVEHTGSINEMLFSLAGNYQERLMIGATIGVPFLSFRQEKIYKESDPDDDVPFFDALEFRETVNTTGFGINFKLGMILRMHQAFRLGFAVHTPTAFSLDDDYNTAMTYDFTVDNQSDRGEAESPDGVFEYKLNTPWRMIGSVGVILNKAGFLTGEVEWVDYGNARLRFDGFAEDERIANDSINTLLTSVLNIRLGGEYAYDIFRFRGGFGIHPSALELDAVDNYSYSVGFGIREERYFVDFAYQRLSLKERYVPYLTSVSPQQYVDNDLVRNKFLLTVGFRF